MPLLKPLIVAFFILWHFSVTIVLANSGSYIAGQFAEKEGDFRNASYYYVDLISRGDSEIILLPCFIEESRLSLG